MKVSAYQTFGDYSTSLDVEFNSEIKSDCEQSEKYIFTFIDSKKCISYEIEAVEDAHT